MKNKLEKAQDYMDAGMKIPKELIAQMNNGERGILEGISEFQRELADSLNEYISDKSFVLSAREPEPAAGTHFSKKAVLLAAALFVCAVGIPFFRTIQTTRIIKEETREFVASITGSSWNEELLSEDIISSDWFEPGPLIELF